MGLREVTESRDVAEHTSEGKEDFDPIALDKFDSLMEDDKLSESEAGDVEYSFEDGDKLFDEMFADDAEDKEPRHLKTINEDLEGKIYPGTDVKYERREFSLNGEKVEGVFPVFKDRFNTDMPKSLWNASDTDQFKYCTAELKQRIEKNPDLEKQFNARQIAQIKDGAPRISGFTWHHSEMPGHIQLVDAREHDICRHTGGRSVWGGGSECR